MKDPAKKPAGGFPAIRATIAHLRKEKAVVSGLAALWRVNQEDGFDCPGCAWPEAGDRSILEFCENGAKAVAAEATTKRVEPEFFATHSVADLARQSDYWLEQQGRLAHPMIKRNGATHYAPIAWAEAFALAGERLKALENPNRAVFYTSGRTSNEAAFLYQLFGRMYGTNNFPDCSNMCHESSGVALSDVVGIGKGSVQLHDFEHCDAVFVIGQNPGTNHPRMLATLLKARRRGATIISINPLREQGLVSFSHPQEPLALITGHGSPLASVFLQLKPGSDVAVFKGIMKHVLAAERATQGVLDHAFIEAHTTGFEALAADLDATPWTDIERESGLAEADIRPASEAYLASKATIFCWAMGLTQHKNAVDNVIACSNLALLRGNIGRLGAGLCPVRGHSNVQGDRTVGINHTPAPAFLDALGAAFRFDPPRRHGHDVVAAIEAMARGEVDVLVSMGGNLAAAAPDSDATHAALRRVGLTIHAATKLNRSHVVAGDTAMIWPVIARSEIDRQASGPQQVTVEDSMSCVHASRGRNTPASPALLSEPAIVAGLAKATLPADGRVDWDGFVADYDRIRDAIERTIPGFERYNARLDEPGGFVLPHPAARREWRTASGRAEFRVTPTPHIRLRTGELRLFTIRSHDQYNTTIYGENDRYRGIAGKRRVLFANASDLADRDLRAGEIVDLRAEDQAGRLRVAPGFEIVPYDVPRECCAAYFPETNVLIALDDVADRSNQPVSKMVPVTLVRS